jgi:hypothetical protein
MARPSPCGQVQGYSAMTTRCRVVKRLREERRFYIPRVAYGQTGVSDHRHYGIIH